MKVHRFYVGDTKLILKQNFWVHDAGLLWQWGRVLRFKPGQTLVLFNGQGDDKMYKIVSISAKEVHLEHVTDMEPIKPKRPVYLFWSLIKNENNSLVIQKATELGATNLVPILTERAVKTGFNLERAEKIAIEASEQSGRSTIPHIREPISLDEMLSEYAEKLKLFVCHFGQESPIVVDEDESTGVIIGPEGGWSDEEVATMITAGAQILELGKTVLRAETAAIIAVSKFV